MEHNWCFPKKGDKIRGLAKVFEGREYKVDYVKSALDGETRIFTTLGTYFHPWECKLISKGSNNIKKFRSFQFRWKEALGKPECPYLYRWTLILFGYSIRLHHWIKSDDRRFFHDHSCDLISIIIKGSYHNVTPAGKFLAVAWRPRLMKAEEQHYLDIPKGGAWTILLCSRPYHKWGFYVKNHKWRPLRYFHKFGIIQDENYQ